MSCYQRKSIEISTYWVTQLNYNMKWFQNSFHSFHTCWKFSEVIITWSHECTSNNFVFVQSNYREIRILQTLTHWDVINEYSLKFRRATINSNPKVCAQEFIDLLKMRSPKIAIVYRMLLWNPIFVFPLSHQFTENLNTHTDAQRQRFVLRVSSSKVSNQNLSKWTALMSSVCKDCTPSVYILNVM